jgi:hypothetical protein
MLFCVLSAHIFANATPFDSFKENSKAASSNDADDQTPHFNQISSEIVVPSYDFHFDALDFEFKEQLFTSAIYHFPAVCIELFSYKNSYLDKLFEHHIAINAP